MTNVSTFDNQERLHLAYRALEQNDYERSLEHLKILVDVEPENGLAWFLMGSIHAGIGMLDRAKQEMELAVQTGDNVPKDARFLLGLLRLTSGDPDGALEAWLPLENLEEDNYLLVFIKGLKYLIEDKFERSIEYLERGKVLNVQNPALNKDMDKFIVRIREHMETGSNAPKSPLDTQINTTQASHILLSAYENQNQDSQ